MDIVRTMSWCQQTALNAYVELAGRQGGTDPSGCVELLAVKAGQQKASDAKKDSIQPSIKSDLKIGPRNKPED
jgi:hypothetical protein